MKTIKALFLSVLLLTSTLVFAQSFNVKLGSAGEEISKDEVVYDGSYRQIDYPNGDVPEGVGVCTDVIIRAYRKLNIDLQKEVHEDIIKNIDKYGRVKKADKNIDHRRVPNLVVFFKRFGKVLPITNKPSDYKPGDVICWKLGGSIDHIGLVVNKKSKDGKRYLVVHNIGGGQNVEDFLFGDKIVGHYSYGYLSK